MNEHVLKSFENELTKLRYRLLRMGTLVQNQVDMAMRALVDSKKELAEEVIELETKVDNLDLKIDSQCLRIFALHQPVASDLRLVLSSVSINETLETVGDHASSMAEILLNLNLKPGFIHLTKFNELRNLISEIFSKVMDSLMFNNSEHAAEAIRLQRNVKAYYQDNHDILKEIMKQDINLIDDCAYLIDINRNLRTISRLARGVAEDIIYMIDARIVKHDTLSGNINYKEPLEESDIQG